MTTPFTRLATASSTHPDQNARDSQPVQLIWESKQSHNSPPHVVKATSSSSQEIILANHLTSQLILGRLEDILPTLPDHSIDFIYLDPPFMTQKNFTIKKKTYRKHQLRLACDQPDLPEQKSEIPAGYSDCWERTAYLDFLDTAFRLLKPLLKPTGSIAVHTDHRVSHFVRCLLDEHFSPDNFINELIWKYGLGNARATRHFLRKHDNIAIYAATSTKKHYFHMIRGNITKAQKAKYCHHDEQGSYMLSYGKKYYLKGGKPLESVLDIPALSATSSERSGYPTQKPTTLLKVLIEAFCPPNGIVLDPCCGSGTTPAAAEKLSRRWIAIDPNPSALGIARNRLDNMAK